MQSAAKASKKTGGGGDKIDISKQQQLEKARIVAPARAYADARCITRRAMKWRR